jgi:hypothetical protein
MERNDKKRWKRKEVALPEKLDQIRCGKVHRNFESPNSRAAAAAPRREKNQSRRVAKIMCKFLSSIIFLVFILE